MRSVIVLSVALTVVVPVGAQRLTPAQRARAGWEALNAGRPQQAAAAFDEALRDEPREPALRLGAGVAAHLLGRSETERRYLVDSLKYDPALTPASLLLGFRLLVPGSGFRLPASGFRLPASGFWLPASGFRL